MGCFQSLVSRDNNSLPGATAEIEQHRADGSSRSAHGGPGARVSTSARSRSMTDDNNTDGSPRRSTQTAEFPLSEHYNEPIRQHIWHSKRRLWTRAELDQERKEFFETRVTGRPEIWAALSSTISLLQAGDLATAQGIIDAAGVTVPTGDLCEGCYDEQGALYRLPQCIVSDPENMVQSSAVEGDDLNDGEDGDPISDVKLASEGVAANKLSSDEVERRRDEKGKTSERDLIKVKVRLSDRGSPDVVISVGKTQSVGFIARKVQEEAGIPGHKRVRIAYLGKVLKEHTSLLNQGWKTGHIVNAFVVAQSFAS